MASLWTNFVSRCKTRRSALARSCFLGREHWRSKVKELEQACEELRDEAARAKTALEQAEQENAQMRERVSGLEAELAQLPSMLLPLGETPPGQQYGDGMIGLCVNLARHIGLRPTARALRIVFKWLKAKVSVPTYQTIRLWMQRIGLDRMRRAKKRRGGAWLTDHSNQISREKVLAVLRVPLSTMPLPDAPLRHEDVEVLALVPSEDWKREDVEKVYQETAERYGHPRAIESDGAVELREPAKTLGKPGETPLVIRDPKHFLANKFEALLKQDPQYDEFTQQLGRSRCALQQTELAHFIPPAFKSKARFMNMASMLKWALAILYHLAHPESLSRKGVTEERLMEKLGWLQNLAPSIRKWQACQEVITQALQFINQHGLYRGAAKQLQKELAGITHQPISRKLADTFLEFLREHENKLRPNERLPMSTEILESSFSLYKQLEKQHSKSGFTSLLLTYPTLLRETTPEEVRVSFTRTKVADVKQWTKENLPQSLAFKRQLMFREANTKTEKRATRKLRAA